MGKRRKLMTKVFSFVILFTGLCWPETGDAYEPWEGKAITVLNVRKSPDIDSQAIGWLDKGQKITINGEQKLWYKIIFEIKEKKYRVGWVYRRYVRRISAEKMEISSALAKVRAGIVKDGSKKKIPSKASAGRDHRPNDVEKEVKKASVSGEIRVVKDQESMAPRKGLPGDKEVMRGPLSEKKINAVKEQNHAASRTKPSAPKMEVVTSPPPEIAPAIGKRADTPPRTGAPVVEKPLTQAPSVSHPEKSLTGTQEFKELAKLGLRLLSVVLSCLAILFSFKAIKLSKISYDTAMQLQRSLQVWQQREDGQLG